MSYFAADEQLLRSQPGETSDGRIAGAPRPADGRRPAIAGGYFKADESARGSAATPGAAPWGVRLVEAPHGSGLLLSWRKPYCRVEGFVVEGAQAGGEWRKLGECAADCVQARITLAPGHWRIRVVAGCNGASVPGEEVECRVPPGMAVMPEQVSLAPSQDQLLLLDQQSMILGELEQGSAQEDRSRAGVDDVVGDSRGGPACPQPGCGAPLSLAASGNLCCEYCGAPAVPGEAGEAIPLEALLYGACSCCRPRRPLIRRGDYLVCPGKPDAGRYPVPVPEASRSGAHPLAGGEAQPPPELSWEAIDRALRENSAVLGRHGLFIRG